LQFIASKTFIGHRCYRSLVEIDWLKLLGSIFVLKLSSIFASNFAFPYLYQSNC